MEVVDLHHGFGESAKIWRFYSEERHRFSQAASYDGTCLQLALQNIFSSSNLQIVNQQMVVVWSRSMACFSSHLPTFVGVIRSSGSTRKAGDEVAMRSRSYSLRSMTTDNTRFQLHFSRWLSHWTLEQGEYLIQAHHSTIEIHLRTQRIQKSVSDHTEQCHTGRFGEFKRCPQGWEIQWSLILSEKRVGGELKLLCFRSSIHRWNDRFESTQRTVNGKLSFGLRGLRWGGFRWGCFSGRWGCFSTGRFLRAFGARQSLQ